jgi:hypothetical protein
VSKTTRTIAIVVALLLALMWAAHHLELSGLLQRLHGA